MSIAKCMCCPACLVDIFLRADIGVRVDTCTSLLPDGKPRYVMGVVRLEFLRLVGVMRN